MNGIEGRSSAIPFSEFDVVAVVRPEGCDQTAFKCSGSGALLAGDSFREKLKGDLPHAELVCAEGGVTGLVPDAWGNVTQFIGSDNAGILILTDSSELLWSELLGTRPGRGISVVGTLRGEPFKDLIVDCVDSTAILVTIV